MMHKNYINLVELDKKYAKLFKKLVIFQTFDILNMNKSYTWIRTQNMRFISPII